MRLTSRFWLHLLILLVVSLSLSPRVAAAQAIADPGPLNPNERTYLDTTRPFRERIGAYREMLAWYQAIASEGKLDSIALDELGNLTRELFEARRTFGEVTPTTRLDQYDRTVKLGLDRAYEATVLLMRAQVTESDADHQSLIRQAGEYGRNSQRLLQEADDALRAVVPATTP
ncbi:MAG: hypothetical protein IT306_31540 [Chloroflexi bacterium]|nr:hypothetical protein [Chloroflexota bacterium]